MAIQVVSGAMMKCSYGVAPSSLNVLPINRVMAGAPAANVMDMVPMLNIPPFGMCQSMANPDGRRSDCRRAWSLNPDALHSHASRTLVARVSQGQSWPDESAI